MLVSATDQADDALDSASKPQSVNSPKQMSAADVSTNVSTAAVHGLCTCSRSEHDLGNCNLIASAVNTTSSDIVLSSIGHIVKGAVCFMKHI